MNTPFPRKPSVYDLLQQKGRQKFLQLHVDTPAEAAAAIEAGIQILSCEPDRNLEAIRRAAPTGFLSAGMPHGSISSQTEAIRAGFEILKRGADAVYCSHSPQFIEAMAREGIPVTGHVGLVPNWATWTNFRAIGKTPEEALRVFQHAKDQENAGAAFLEVEVIPEQLAAYITQNVRMITMGMGCGTACDTQYLFSSDVLGTNRGHMPRHSKQYADIPLLEAQVQSARVKAFQAFARDCAQGAYPEARHAIRMEDQAFESFTTQVQSNRH